MGIGNVNEGYENGYVICCEGNDFKLNESEIPIPYNKFANPNATHGFGVQIPVNRVH